MYCVLFIAPKTTYDWVVDGLFIMAFVLFFFRFVFRYFEMGYALLRKKPIYTHWYWRLQTISPEQERLLVSRLAFYKRLTPKRQRYFKHRLATFINDKEFVGRQGLEMTEEVKVLISATAVMLTFGFRNYVIEGINTILVYPSTFYSQTNDNHHKGEFNPKLKTLVLSWEDFVMGLDVTNDNLNLGVHEFAHAIHLNSKTYSNINGVLFLKSFEELVELLTENQKLKQDLLDSQYLRDYAFTNQYEFVAVIIESFIETPREFRSQFPQLYTKTKQMLNFNFAGY
ncbi:MAG: zinc-dependent peptidase [Algicola sp.]|nr:zinc-dependent peptidase [Algicola sp.]